MSHWRSVIVVEVVLLSLLDEENFILQDNLQDMFLHLQFLQRW